MVTVRFGSVWQVGLRSSRYGSVECGGVWFGNAGEVRRGSVWFGVVLTGMEGCSKAGTSRLVAVGSRGVWSGMVRQVWLD